MTPQHEKKDNAQDKNNLFNDHTSKDPYRETVWDTSSLLQFADECVLQIAIVFYETPWLL